MYATLKKLIPARPSISGHESGIRAILTDLMRPFVDEISTDAMGNLICCRKGKGKDPRRVVLVAHMDEIGFVVNFIEESGLVRVAPIGGVSLRAATGCPVIFENGTRGVFCHHADVKGDQEIKSDVCFVDIGAKNRAEAARRVHVGDGLALTPHLFRLAGKRVAGRPLDDRIGCAVLVRIAESLTDPVPEVDFVFSVQEEVGCRGARPAAFALQPETVLAFDVTGTGDVPGASHMAVKLGDGVAVKIKDASVLCHQGLVAELLATAKEKGIKAQSEVLLYGGTDTGAMQMTGAGCRAGALSVPCRYVHSGVETLDLGDAEAAVALALAYLKAKA